MNFITALHQHIITSQSVTAQRSITKDLPSQGCHCVTNQNLAVLVGRLLSCFLIRGLTV